MRREVNIKREDSLNLFLQFFFVPCGGIFSFVTCILTNRGPFPLRREKISKKEKKKKKKKKGQKEKRKENKPQLLSLLGDCSYNPTNHCIPEENE